MLRGQGGIHPVQSSPRRIRVRALVNSSELKTAAVIGLGPHGKRIVGVLSSMPGIKLSAVVDSREEALAWPEIPPAAAKHKSADALFAAGAPDVVCIATNGPSHAKLAIDAMNAGTRFLMVEKPFACSLAECDQVMEVAARTKTRVAVDQSCRHAVLYRWLREQIASGRWGEPRAFWMQRQGIGLGCNGIHSFDLARFLSGRDVERVTGWVDAPIKKNPRGEQFVDPGGLVVMEMGRALRCVVAQVEDGAGPVSLELDLTAARVYIDERSGTVDVIERDLSVIPGPGRPAVFRKGVVPESAAKYPDMAPSIRGTLDELVGGGAMDCDATHGRAALEVLVGAYLSSQKENTPVKLPLTSKEGRELWLPIT